jgi:hypothetical protein
MLENISGAGNRLDFGMLTFACPPADLLSFVIDSAEEPIRGGSDLSLIVRSRMPGMLGLSPLRSTSRGKTPPPASVWLPRRFGWFETPALRTIKVRADSPPSVRQSGSTRPAACGGV